MRQSSTVWMGHVPGPIRVPEAQATVVSTQVILYSSAGFVLIQIDMNWIFVFAELVERNRGLKDKFLRRLLILRRIVGQLVTLFG